MTPKTRPRWIFSITALFTAALCFLFAQEGPDWNKGLPKQYKSKWLVHDINRPQPPVVAPGKTPGAPPSDALVLFDGKDLSRWINAKTGGPAGWKVENGHAELNATGDIRTKEEFGDCQLHVEWAAPAVPKGVSQGRGNSGIYFMERYEVQVLDSYNNKTYADGSAASVYGQHPPLANACNPPGEWQVYDLIFRAPRFKDGKLAEPARVTVFHNGVAVQHHGLGLGRPDVHPRHQHPLTSRPGASGWPGTRRTRPPGS